LFVLYSHYSLFKNTKSDLGSCSYSLHEENLREEYTALTENEKSKYGYELNLLHKLRAIVREMDRKIAKNKQRANEENMPKPLSEEQKKLLDLLATRIHQLTESSQEFGDQGEVEQSLHAALEAEKIKTERESLEQRLKYPNGRIMFVCEVCGVFINSTDSEARRADHYNGKQYLGWKTIREKLRELENEISRKRSDKCSVSARVKSRSSSRRTISTMKSIRDSYKDYNDYREQTNVKHKKKKIS
jgi:rubrerythrin